MKKFLFSKTASTGPVSGRWKREKVKHFGGPPMSRKKLDAWWERVKYLPAPRLGSEDYTPF